VLFRLAPGHTQLLLVASRTRAPWPAWGRTAASRFPLALRPLPQEGNDILLSHSCCATIITRVAAHSCARIEAHNFFAWHY
jgi:hypothetical protein